MKMTNQEIRKAMQQMGSKGGKKAAANMTAAQRRARATKAAAAKYGKLKREFKDVRRQLKRTERDLDKAFAARYAKKEERNV